MRRIVLSAPGKNALSIAVLEGLRIDVEACDGDPFLLTGDGDVFCAGLNLKELASLDGAGMRRLLNALDGAVEALFHHPAPTVALVNGHAIAGGAVLAMCCDVVVVRDDPRIRMGLNETAIGLPFPPKVTALARHRLPRPALERVLLGGALHAPAEARALGLADEVAADAEAVAGAVLARLAAHPRAAYALNKRQLRSAALESPDEVRLFEEILPLWDSDETRGRAAAALKGR
jgi:enoyl-CoA hydratase/carnithine racemase